MKLQILTLYNKRVLSILLLFLLTKIYGQQITIDNKNDFILEISSKDQIIKLNKGEKKEFSANGYSSISKHLYKKNTRELINSTELVLADYFSKVKSSLNSTKIMRGSSQYIEIENYITTSWLSSLFFFITGEKILDNQSKELILYYFNKYIKKDIDRYKCEYDGQYNVINELAKYNKQLGITLPRYDIKVSSGYDLINQYLPESCRF